MNAINSIISFLTSNQVILCSMLVAILDFAFALNKNLAANGILHALYLFFSKESQGSSSQQQPPQS